MMQPGWIGISEFPLWSTAVVPCSTPSPSAFGSDGSSEQPNSDFLGFVTFLSSLCGWLLPALLCRKILIRNISWRGSGFEAARIRRQFGVTLTAFLFSLVPRFFWCGTSGTSTITTSPLRKSKRVSHHTTSSSSVYSVVQKRWDEDRNGKYSDINGIVSTLTDAAPRLHDHS